MAGQLATYGYKITGKIISLLANGILPLTIYYKTALLRKPSNISSEVDTAIPHNVTARFQLYAQSLGNICYSWFQDEVMILHQR